ncbi:hypothetical protein HacjB3_19618 (plasmid) [Halalkalicoccus jeotgali B3]|uniref:Uncharacterized protein n=1 Tax=Halalkalicoccus jeotgali (strain DSM 18796 / CECT 7217 / JCM 14584 / KCTC 4019 / B3) TaxID=795797 RepID=D8JDA6_HALJB|nr:hypothetical protein [Halalkalicoccus jeotgali]ADJ17266.1 hypothetical protein HacjB3_19618 [Halalkalicoccus jeotgali B3]
MTKPDETDADAANSAETNGATDMDDNADPNETSFVGTDVLTVAKDAVKAKRGHGGISEVIRDAINREAFGEQLNRRGQLEARREELVEKRAERREELREVTNRLEGEIDALGDEIDTLDTKLNSLTTREERYEAKLESLEYWLRVKGMRFDPGNGRLKEVAASAGREPEGVIQDLKLRNPDVPDVAFGDGDPGDTYNPPDSNQTALKSTESTGGDGEITPLRDREEIYREREPATETEPGTEPELIGDGSGDTQDNRPNNPDE